MIRLAAALLSLSVAAPALASAGMSPADRKLRQLLIGAATSCEAPIVIFGTKADSLGGTLDACGNGVETLSLRGDAVHVRILDESAKEAAAATYGDLACVPVYKYSPPGSVTTYNVNSLGPNTFQTSTVCVSGATSAIAPDAGKRNPEFWLSERGSIGSISDNLRPGTGFGVDGVGFD